MNSSAVDVPLQSVTDLGALILDGTASTSSEDYAELSNGSSLYLVSGDDVLGARNGWQSAEFNIYGNGDLSEAEFNSGSALTVEIQLANAAGNHRRIVHRSRRVRHWRDE
jgi:hypothetical protein